MVIIDFEAQLLICELCMSVIALVCAYVLGLLQRPSKATTTIVQAARAP